ncbi:MAG: 16S rRNA (uracil(1498)-N(3))-methyltransferase [Flavobacteriaceae bacterium]|nr:16S rRNA (uracil(1498)-N(3))-methyltransferase [Flavobacteriaceae bacterium]
MQLFYNKNIKSKDKQFIFDKTESKHIIRVLRKKEGDLLYITNGKGLLFTVKIINASDKKCFVEILEEELKENQLHYNLHIAIAPTKNKQRLEWFLEKATEIGVRQITLIICINSERKTVNKERLEKILITAMKQSNRYYLPKLNKVITYKKFINQELNGDLFIAHCEKTDKKTLKSQLNKNKNTTILIGPEGDFSLTEIKLALQNKYKAVSLAKSRLRTETAGIVAVQNVSFFNE